MADTRYAMAGLLQGLQARKAQQQALIAKLIESGQLQPSPDRQPQGIMSSIHDAALGPNIPQVGGSTQFGGATWNMPKENMLGMGNLPEGASYTRKLPGGEITYKAPTKYEPKTREEAISFEREKNQAKGTLQEKSRQYTEKQIQALGKDLDPSQYRAGAFGVSKQVFDRAERLESLAIAFPDGNLDRRQIEELAIGLNSMLSGANVGAQEQVKALVPQSVWGNVQKLTEFLANNPTGTQQQQFVERMLGSIGREKATAQQQINRTRFSRLGKYQNLELAHKKEFEDVLRSYEINPDDYYAWKKGGYKPISAVQSPGQQSSNKDQYGFTPKQQRYSEKYKRTLTYLGNNQWQ